MRLLIVKLSSFGDVVHTFPALTDLKAARPDIEVDWLVEEAFAPFVALHPGMSRSPYARLSPPPQAAQRAGRGLPRKRRVSAAPSVPAATTSSSTSRA